MSKANKGDALQIFSDLTYSQKLEVVYGCLSTAELQEIVEDMLDDDGVWCPADLVWECEQAKRQRR